MPVGSPKSQPIAHGGSIPPPMAKLPRTPDLNAQRAAMQKLAFLDGKWNGDATLLHSAGQPVELHQTEEVNYKLDGLVLTIEGIGRKKSDGQELIQAFAIISFDDESATYRCARSTVAAFSRAKSNCSNRAGHWAGGFLWGTSPQNPYSASTNVAIGPNLPKSALAPSLQENSSISQYAASRAKRSLEISLACLRFEP
jgi:hypothetical protein